MQANAVAVRFLLLECIVVHFECLSKRVVGFSGNVAGERDERCHWGARNMLV